MPVHHSLLWIPEIQGEEFHGPIDGVRPIDYPEWIFNGIQVRHGIRESTLSEYYRPPQNLQFLLCYDIK
ncbi:hypothetical protein RF55_14234 [Lasius niger]|uniref:Uncharacterized protein n=1 Tax=Lasius niger TaxID=67767 RepID=A0A0J7K8Q2_LASNI|nr:hypothetical protein RF55_14234 [Lasius niger]